MGYEEVLPLGLESFSGDSEVCKIREWCSGMVGRQVRFSLNQQKDENGVIIGDTLWCVYWIWERGVGQTFYGKFEDVVSTFWNGVK